MSKITRRWLDADLTNQLTGMQGDIINLKAGVTGMQVNIAGMTGAINAIQGTIAGMTGAISNLEVSCTGVGNSILGLTGSVYHLATYVYNLQAINVGFSPITGAGSTNVQGSIEALVSYINDAITGISKDAGLTGAVGETGIQGYTGIQGSTGYGGVITHGQLINMPDVTGMVTDHDIRLVTKVQPNTPTLPIPFTGMLWYDTDAIEDMGVTGPTGDTGLGVTGPQGYTGLSIPGYTGLRGETGLRGYTGSQGSTGVSIPGYTGLRGETGLRGYTGSQGFTGLIGNTGSQGHTGVQGHTGSPGITGLLGATGLRGETGFQGHTGASVVGETGFQGATGLFIIGSTGIQGETGSQGVTGVSGDTGLQGNTGLGLQGFIGETGSQGVTGLAGVSNSGFGTLSIVLNEITLNLSSYEFFEVILTDSVNTVTTTNIVNGKVNYFSLRVAQDGVGGRTFTPPASWKYPGGVAYTVSSGVNNIDIIQGITYDNGTNWLISFMKGFA
jgi:hypothetical protein